MKYDDAVGAFDSNDALLRALAHQPLWIAGVRNETQDYQ